MDRLGFWGRPTARRHGSLSQFQYPLMDRLGFWGTGLRQGANSRT